MEEIVRLVPLEWDLVSVHRGGVRARRARSDRLTASGWGGRDPQVRAARGAARCVDLQPQRTTTSRWARSHRSRSTHQRREREACRVHQGAA